MKGSNRSTTRPFLCDLYNWKCVNSKVKVLLPQNKICQLWLFYLQYTLKIITLTTAPKGHSMHVRIFDLHDLKKVKTVNRVL